MLFGRHSKESPGTPKPEDADPHAVKHHRDRMAGMWAAELLGLIGQTAQDYARELAATHREDDHHDDEKVAHRLAGDLHGKANLGEIRDKLAHLVHEARRQLLDGTADKDARPK